MLNTSFKLGDTLETTVISDNGAKKSGLQSYRKNESSGILTCISPEREAFTFKK